MEMNEITFAKAIKNGYKNWDNSEGRISRKEYWYFFLFNLLILPVKMLLYWLVVGLFSALVTGYSTKSIIIYLLLYLLWIVVDYPLFNATKRRLNDAGYFNKFVWLGLIATPPAMFHILTLIEGGELLSVFSYIIGCGIFGVCVLLYMLCQKSS